MSIGRNHQVLVLRNFLPHSQQSSVISLVEDHISEVFLEDIPDQIVGQHSSGTMTDNNLLMLADRDRANCSLHDWQIVFHYFTL